MEILMAIIDYVPVGLFLAAAIIYQRLFYNKMSKGAFALFSCGTILVFVAGFYKATHKLLYYTGVCDWTALKTQFFPMQTTGFVLAAAGILAMMFYKQGEGKAYSIVPFFLFAPLATQFVAPEEFSGTMIFVALMVLGVAILDGVLITIAAKRKEFVNIIIIVIAFIFTLGMGYLSSKDSMFDWIKEFVNSVGQGAFLASAIYFKKHNLADQDALKGISKHS